MEIGIDLAVNLNRVLKKRGEGDGDGDGIMGNNNPADQRILAVDDNPDVLNVRAEDILGVSYDN